MPPRGLPDWTRSTSVTVSFPSPEIKNPYVVETSVTTAGIPNVHDVKANLERNGGDGYIINDGPGELYVYVSYDGKTWSNKITLLIKEVLRLSGLSIAKVKIDTDTDGTSYRMLVI